MHPITPITQDTRVDVAIIGSGPAGLNAALILGRARLHVLVIDAGHPRHEVSEGVHGFLTREGISPAALREISRSQIAAFPSVTFAEDFVEDAQVTESADPHTWPVTLRCRGGGTIHAKALLLAVGVKDIHLTIPGFSQFWGRSIHLCPYCHGWESRDQPIGVLGIEGQMSHLSHLALLLRNWSADVTVFTNGQELSDEQKHTLQHANIRLVEGVVTSLHGEHDVLASLELAPLKLARGEHIPCRNLFAPLIQVPVPLVKQLKLATDQEPYIQVTPMMQTNRPHIWAAGDCTTRFQSALLAAANGSIAAFSTHMTLTLPHSP